MNAIGMYGLLTAITPSSNNTTTGLTSSPSSVQFKTMLRRYLFGLHEKTKRSLAEEAECGDEISVVSWIKDGTSPDEPDAYGYTPLLNACCTGRLNAVEQLIKNNADVNKQGPFGFTPLHAAAQLGHREIVQYLLENGADINAQNDDMDTPLHLAITTRQIEIVNLLIRNGSNVFIKGFNKKDCVGCAEENGLGKLAEYLKQYGVCMKHQAALDSRYANQVN